MNVTVLHTSQWTISTRRRGEVLSATASAGGVNLAVLSIPDGFTVEEFEGWLRDLIVVAQESARGDAEPKAIPALLHHALTGLLFSHAELWERSGTGAPCSIALVAGEDEIALGWVGEANVRLWLGDQLLDASWVIVRDDSGREARAIALDSRARVRLQLEWSASGASEAGATLEAWWQQESDGSGPLESESGGGSPSASEAPPFTTSAEIPSATLSSDETMLRHTLELAAELGAASPRTEEPFAADLHEIPALHPATCESPMAEPLDAAFDPNNDAELSPECGEPGQAPLPSGRRHGRLAAAMSRITSWWSRKPNETTGADPGAEAAPDFAPDVSADMAPDVAPAHSIPAAEQPEALLVEEFDPHLRVLGPAALAPASALPPVLRIPMLAPPPPAPPAVSVEESPVAPAADPQESVAEVPPAAAFSAAPPSSRIDFSRFGLGMRVAPGSDSPPLPALESPTVPSFADLETPPQSVIRTAARAVGSAPFETQAISTRPRPRRAWPSTEDLERPVPHWKRPWVWVAAVVVLFAVGWLVGGQQSDRVASAPARGLTRALRAIGIGGAHFDVAVSSRPPGAWIAVDGKDLGRRTPASLDLAAGRHQVTLSFSDQGGATWTVAGERGQQVALDGDLWGSLTIVEDGSSMPITVELDGRALGYAPVVIDSVQPGPHEVRFAAPGAVPWGQTVEVRVRQRAEVLAHPMTSPATGMIDVRASLTDEQGDKPLAGAEVWIDGDLRGRTPFSLELARGPHSIRAVYHNETAPVQVIDLPGGNQRFASFEFGLGLEHPSLTSVTALDHVSPDHAVVASASLEGVSVREVHEMWLHVRTPEGPWRRYQMEVLKSTYGALGATVFPATMFGEQGETRYYMSALTNTGDEYFTDVSVARLEGAKRPAAPAKKTPER